MKLRPLKEQDAPFMIEWMHDPDIVRDMHRDFASMTEEDCLGFIRSAGENTDRDLHLAITSDDILSEGAAPDEYLGTVSLKNIDRNDHTAEFGITIRRCAMGAGVAGDAMSAILEKARDLGLNMIYWCVSPKNERALRFYDKNGYKRIAINEEPALYQKIISAGTYSPSEIEDYVWYIYDMDQTGATTDTDDIVDVSVYMMTYFHEKYVRQAIESVLSQKTHYKFELVISDDCSLDGTVEILREYEAKYPDIVRVNVNETNLGIPSNIYIARTMCRGRYITNLSGDDYWINDAKLETEVKYLDEHPEYVAAACRVEERMDDSTVAYNIVPSDFNYIEAPYTLRDYEKCRPLGTLGLVMRNFFLTEEDRAYFAQAREISPFVDDAVDEVLLLRRGPVRVMGIISDAHRVVKADLDKQNYNSRYSRPEKFKHHIDLLNEMSKRWGDEIDFSRWYAKYSATGILGMMLSRDFASYKPIFESIPAKYKSSAYLRWIPYANEMVTSRLKRKKS